MKKHFRTYPLPEKTQFKFDSMFFDIDEDYNGKMPSGETIETEKVEFLIYQESKGTYYFSVSIPEFDGISFWCECGLSHEQLESDIEQILERKELFI